MCEINKQNFKEKLIEIKTSLKKCKFIAIDLEFSALDPMDSALSLFDDNKDRYKKLSINLKNVIPLQVGITAFHFDHENNNYTSETFSFYINPPAFGYINRNYFFQSSTTHFLCLNNFDFNKFAYSGLPFLTKSEENQLRKHLNDESFTEFDSVLCRKIRDLIQEFHPIVSDWYHAASVDESFEIPQLKQFENFTEIRYFIHKHFRLNFKNLWTYEERGKFYVKKLNPEEYNKKVSKCNLDENLIDELIGFNHVFELIKSLGKPLVGHNLLQDLMILINTFEQPLPTSYYQFKELVHRLFPSIFDTKTIFYELRDLIPKEKKINVSSLENLFEYFKNGTGRHLANDKTAIEHNFQQKDLNKFHDAGWDSFCTGYIFLRMAYLSLAPNYSKKKQFVPNELIGGLLQMENKVNLIKGSTAYVNFGGDDPSSRRPPWLIVESVKNEPVDIHDLTSLLSCYGCADVKKLSSNGRRVLVAVDTYRAAKEISRSFKSHPIFQVQQFSPLKHTKTGQVFLLGAATLSGALLFWLTHSMVKRTIR